MSLNTQETHHTHFSGKIPSLKRKKLHLLRNVVFRSSTKLPEREIYHKVIRGIVTARTPDVAPSSCICTKKLFIRNPANPFSIHFLCETQSSRRRRRRMRNVYRILSQPRCEGEIAFTLRKISRLYSKLHHQSWYRISLLRVAFRFFCFFFDG